MNVLVTGGAGYIGSALVATLLAEHHVVRVVERLLFGGEALLAFCHHPGFSFTVADAASLPDDAFAGAAAFDGDMRDVRVSFEKVRTRLAFRPRVGVDEGIVEIRDAVLNGLIRDPQAAAFRNAAPLLPHP